MILFVKIKTILGGIFFQHNSRYRAIINTAIKNGKGIEGIIIINVGAPIMFLKSIVGGRMFGNLV